MEKSADACGRKAGIWSVTTRPARAQRICPLPPARIADSFRAVSRAPFLSITDQAAEHLRAEILRGRWTGTLPGRHQLAAELSLNSKTVEAALRQLEADGLLVPQGAGRRRRINPKGGSATRALRIAILPFDLEADRKVDYMVDLHHSLLEAGHAVFYTPRSLTELHFDLGKIARLVEGTRADAWVVLAGSREVPQWFAARPEPAFAIFGQREGLPIASFGPDKAPACAAATRRFIELGHQRIVLLCRRARRVPVPSLHRRAEGRRHPHRRLQSARLGGNQRRFSTMPRRAFPRHPAHRAPRG